MRVAVVGVGAAGLATALQLTDDGPVDLDLTLFDPQFKDPEQSARGRAYQMDHGGPLLNAPSSMMSVRADDEEDFARWMRRRSVHAGAFVPRPIYGNYLAESLDSLKRQWGTRSGTLHCVPFEALSVTSASDGKLAVGTLTARFHLFDAVFLCTGWGVGAADTDQNTPAYPLDGMLLRALGMDHVGVIGTGLTAVDVAKALLSHGYRGRITLASRRGLLPGTRVAERIVPVVMTRARLQTMDSLDLRGFFRLIECEGAKHGISLDGPRKILDGGVTPRDSLRVETQEDRGWRALFVALCDEAMADVWNLLDEASRRVFLRWLHPYFQSWCNPMPPSTAAGLAKAMDSGQLMVQGGLRSACGGSLAFASGETQAVDLLVSAHRSSTDTFADTRSPLVQSLIAGGHAARDDFGGLRVEYGNWRLQGARGSQLPIYAIGSLAHGARYYVNALDSIVRTVPQAVADALRAAAAARAADVPFSRPRSGATE